MKHRIERDYQRARQREAAKRLRHIVQLIGENPYGHLYRAADLLTNNEDLPDEGAIEFRLVLLVDIILNDQPNRRPTPIPPEDLS